MDLTIRRAQYSDAEQLFELVNEIMGEGQSFYSDSIGYSLEEYRKFIETSSLDNFTFIFVAEIDQLLVGWAILSRRRYKSKFHEANLVLGVKQQFRNRGIGTKMINYIESEALNQGIENIDLFVRGNDFNALNFFKSMHYIQHGLKKQGLKIDGVYEDEILMSKILI